MDLFSCECKTSYQYLPRGFMHPLVKLAIQAVEHFIETGKPLPCPNPLPDDLKQNAGAFVTIKNQDSLRGCVGSMTPKHTNHTEKIST